MRTLTIAALAVVAAGVLVGTGSPAGAAPAGNGIRVACTVTAKAPYLKNGRVLADGTAGCPGVVTNLGVTVSLSRDGGAPVTASRSCRALTCTATVSVADPAGTHLWCVTARRTSPHIGDAPRVCRNL
ncbi:hypothetical protein R8Z50_13965 [Longispora sp. K20-0274]|uniref:hypothetical protein n=1 Tax=Longispora sp. K20-0274 TaxID=3088255 RepID=UPI00399AD63A